MLGCSRRVWRIPGGGKGGKELEIFQAPLKSKEIQEVRRYACQSRKLTNRTPKGESLGTPYALGAVADNRQHIFFGVLDRPPCHTYEADKVSMRRLRLSRAP